MDRGRHCEARVITREGSPRNRRGKSDCCFEIPARFLGDSSSDEDPGPRERTATRKALVQILMRVFPDILCLEVFSRRTRDRSMFFNVHQAPTRAPASASRPFHSVSRRTASTPIFRSTVPDSFQAFRRCPRIQNATKSFHLYLLPCVRICFFFATSFKYRSMTVDRQYTIE